MPNFQLTPDVLAFIAGAFLSALFSYTPGLSVAFAKLGPEVKRLIMLVLLVAMAVVIFVMGCNGIVQAGLTCDNQGFWQLVYMTLLAIVANQGMYAIAPQLQSVKDARPPLKLPPIDWESIPPSDAPASNTGGE